MTSSPTSTPCRPSAANANHFEPRIGRSLRALLRCIAAGSQLGPDHADRSQIHRLVLRAAAPQSWSVLTYRQYHRSIDFPRCERFITSSIARQEGTVMKANLNGAASITGASSSIGAIYAQRLARRGTI